ncbi:uncharacterized protein LOC126884548 isoform X2 [Diabrotica virgifera virgifera]|nr:uncharacterized protein LOC126884548 isoform X2 [Diabrotica virgifera virgifera]
MTKHLKLKHPELEETLPGKKLYDSTLCHKKFDTSHASLKHNHKCLKMLTCSLCEYENTSQNKLISHMKTMHSIDIKSQDLMFDSVEKFEQWKTELERDTVSKYNITHGSYVTQKYKRSQYYCQRSGYYIAKGKQLRGLKSQGSKKINGFCPAKIDCRQEGEKCSVTFISTHVGHAADLRHLTLTSTERQEIARKIAQKIPFELILDDIKESVHKESLQRMHLLKRKDLYNIEREFQLNTDSLDHINKRLTVHSNAKEVEPLYLQHTQTISTNPNPSIQERKFFERKSKLLKDVNDILEIVTNLNNDVSGNSTLETIETFVTSVKQTLEASSRHKELKTVNK